MIKKRYYKGGKNCRVWFYLSSKIDADTANLVGDFNGWDRQAHPMKQKKDGTFYTAVTLKTGKNYEFRYLLNGERWENDWDADTYASNEMGSDNSVVEV